MVNKFPFAAPEGPVALEHVASVLGETGMPHSVSDDPICKLHALYDKFNVHIGSGNSHEERWGSDKDNIMIKDLLQCYASLHPLAGLPDADPFPAASAARTAFDAVKVGINDTNAWVTTAHKDNLKAKLDEITSFAKGGQDGKSWHDGVEAGWSLSQVLAHARDTLLKIPNRKLNEAIKSINALKGDYKRVATLFNGTTDKPFIKTAEDLVTTLEVTNAEALLCVAFTEEENTPVESFKASQLKTVVHRINKGLTQAAWDSDVHEMLRHRGNMAMKLKKA
eukprot:4768367-Pyramimonas_sp.AAC.1